MKHLFGFIAVAICLMLVGTSALGQSTYTWIGASGGAWTTSTNWSPSRTTPNAADVLQFNDGTTKTVNISGAFTGGSIQVTGNTSITLTQSGMGSATITIPAVTGDDLVVEAGSSLTISTDVNITLAASSTANISGTLTIGAGRTYTTLAASTVTTITGTLVNSGTITGATAAKCTVAAGGTYEHAQNGGTIPTATWAATSTCLITGVTDAIAGGLGQAFGHFTYNCPGQTGDESLAGSGMSIAGNFTVMATGGAGDRLQMSQTSLTVGGNFTLSGGEFRMADGTSRTLTVTGDFIMSGGLLEMCDGGAGADVGTLNVGGNFNHTSGTIQESSGGTTPALIVFNGSSDQSFSSTGTPTTEDINYTLAKTGGSLNLLSDLNVDGTATLTLTTGNVVTGANVLTLGNSVATVGALSGGSSSSYIVGNFRRWISTTTGARLFPIGTASNYRPATVDFTVAPSTGGTLTAQFVTAGAGGPGTDGLPLSTLPDATDPIPQLLDVIAQVGVWRIDAADALAGGTYSLSLVADGFPNVTMPEALRPVKRPVGSDWALDGTYAANTAGPTINRIGMSGFSEFGLASSSLNNPLPVQLASFTGAVVGNGSVRLDWRTISEVNNYGFYVQKRVFGTTSWNELGFIPGHGTTNEPQNYTYTDNSGISGATQYRLKQVDFDGTMFFTEPILVDLPTSVPELAPKQFALMQNYPNPFNPSTEIKFSVENTGHATLVVYNALGQQVATLFDGVAEAGRYNVVQFNASGLSSGVYFYRLSSSNKSDLKKLVLLK